MAATDEQLTPAGVRAMSNRIEVKAAQTLMGMVTGIVCDQVLHDREIALLSTWLRSNVNATLKWPGDVIAIQVRQVLADGIVTDQEREHLLSVLTEMANADFSVTGSAMAEPLQLPIDDTVSLSMADAGVVHTGTFLYGTRAVCERLSVAMGATPLDTVTRRTDMVVIGTRVTPSWMNESYGRKILRAVELQREGHAIRIVSERRWFEHATSLGKV